MLRRRLVPVLAAALVLSGCSTPDAEPSATSTPSSSSATARASGAGTETAAPSSDPMLEESGDGDSNTAAPAAPIAGDDDRSHAASVASAAFAAFIARDRDATAWIAALAPYLTPTALEAYRHTDPRRVTATRIQSTAVVPTDSAALARVHVVADDGTWLVILSRASGQDWRVERFVPPEPVED